ncbi:ALP1-like protein [Tanacetum coccineum]
MIGSIDCTDWPWENFVELKFVRVITGQILSFYWKRLPPTTYGFGMLFCVSGVNNDMNILRQSPIFNDLKSEKALEVPFVANEVTYKRGCYLTDEIYLEWSVLIKSISNPRSNDHKRIMYKTAHEAARKDVKRAFGVSKRKWKMRRGGGGCDVMADMMRAVT